MKTRIFVLLYLIVYFVVASQVLANPIQWKVEDGGNGHWYEAVVVPDGINWSDARTAAHTSGGYLASITSAEENLFVFNLVSDDKYWVADVPWQSMLGPWLGGYQYDKLDEPAGHWAWDSGESWTYTQWAANKPDDYYGAEDYLHMMGWNLTKSSDWNDMPAIFEQGWIRPNSYVIEFVPEPSTFALLGMGALLLLFYILRIHRRKAIRSVLILSVMLFATSSSLADSAFFDFNSGIGSDFSVFNGSSVYGIAMDQPGGLFNIATNGSNIRISKPFDDGTISPVNSIGGGIRSNFTVIGDFSVTVNFTLTDFPIPNLSEGLNESVFSVVTTDYQSDVSVLRIYHPQSGSWIENWSNPAWYSSGNNSSALMSGQYRLQRSGSVITASFADPGSSTFTQLGSYDGLSAPMRVQLWALQNHNVLGYPRSTTSIDISFDNLSVFAEHIQEIPEPSTFILLSISLVGIFGWNWRQSRIA